MSKDHKTLFADCGQEAAHERVHHMVCVHGSAAYLEAPDSVTAAREHSGLRIEGRNGTRAIVSIPIPTTLVFKGSRLAIRTILLDFATSPGVAVSSVRVFSGSRLISGRDDLNYSGRNRYRQFEIEGHPTLNMPLSLSAVITFGSGHGYFTFISASAVFVERARAGAADAP